MGELVLLAVRRLAEEALEAAVRDLPRPRRLRAKRRGAVLVAWCIDAVGRKRLVHLAPGTKESHECCVEFLHDLQRRGLRDPVLVVTDGAAGVIKAVDDQPPRAFVPGGAQCRGAASRRHGQQRVKENLRCRDHVPFLGFSQLACFS